MVSKKKSAEAPTPTGTVKARRAVVIGGLRTPFVKAFKELLLLDAIDLSRAVVDQLLQRHQLPRGELEAIIWSGVILPTHAPNVGREIALDLGLHWVEAHTCTRACASSLQAIHHAVAGIERGDFDVAIAGGADSTSNAQVTLPKKFVHAVAPVAMGGKAKPADYLQVLAQLAPFTDIWPTMPKVSERTTGETMGQAAERMAQRNGITREAQDEFAARSHLRAAAAIASGRFDEEVIPVETPDGRKVFADTLVRADTSVEKLARLRPVFTRNGTLTAGNSSPLTDGAAAVLLMEEQKARALGFVPKAAFRSFAYVGVDPADQLLMGPALAMPKALARAGMSLSDIGLVDMHEAFAAQVLSILKMLASDGFAKARLGRESALGELDERRFNIHGGSIAIGHPFGATGARMVTTMANELCRGEHSTALLGICAAGGLGAAAVLERV